MNSTDEIIEVLNDLLRINDDRSEEYEEAASQIDSDETTLKGLFTLLAEEGREFSKQLSEKIREVSGGSVTERAGNGKIYRAWMEQEIIFSGGDALAVLGSCEFGEEAAQRAYKDAIETGRDFPNDVRRLIMNQKDMIGLSHNLVRSQRDHHEIATHTASTRENK